MRVSIIIIGYNSWHYLEKCFVSLSFLMQNIETEIIYVDNASSDGTVQNIKTLYPSVVIIENDRNLGIAVARNRGIRQAKGEYIWLLDSDTEINRDACCAMLQFMETHSDTGLCACKLIGQDGQPQASCRRFPSVAGKLNAIFQIIFRLQRTVIQYDMDADKPFEVDYVIGACQFFRRSVQEKVGLLDEHIFYGPEDADFCLRIKQAGYKVYYLPQVSVLHNYQRISAHKPFSKLSRSHFKALIYYFWKHRKK